MGLCMLFLEHYRHRITLTPIWGIVYIIYKVYICPQIFDKTI